MRFFSHRDSRIRSAPELFESECLKITDEPFLLIEGVAQSHRDTIHIKTQWIARLDHSDLQPASSHDFS